MEKRKLGGIFLFVILLSALVVANTFEDLSEGDFNNGTFNETFYNSTTSGIELNISDGFTSGIFTSQIFDAGGVADWNNISWTTELCYRCDLPDNEGTDSGDFVNPTDMSNNVILLHLDESSGTIQDDSGNNNDGDGFGGITYDVTGKFDTGIEFDGSNDRIRVFDDNTLDITDDITIEWWSYAHDFDGDPDVITKGAFNEAYSIWYWTDGSIAFSLNNDRLDSVSTLSTNTWYHIVAVRNGSSRQIYINSVLDSNDTYASAIGTTSSNFFVSTNSFPFDGIMDEVAVYDRALSPSEIKEHYLRGIVDLNISVRSCSTSTCSGEIFSTVSGDSPQDLSVNNNTYFQYQASFETEDTNVTPTLYNFTVDYSLQTFPVSVDVTYPVNTSYTNVQTQLNYTFTGDADSCWYTLDNGNTNTSVTCGTNVTSIDSGQGDSTWTVYLNDTLGVENSSSVSFFVDSIAPDIVITSPTNNSLLDYSNVSISYNVTDAESSLDSCWWTTDNGDVNTSVTCGTPISLSASEGSTTIDIYVNDTLDNRNQTSVTFIVDTTSPSVSIAEPQNGQALGYNESIELNFTATDAGLGIYQCWYTLDDGATNTSILGCANTTFDVSGDGSYTVRIYANDTVNNVGISESNFSVQIGAPTITLVSPVDTYVNETGVIEFQYIATDIDLQFCELWGNFTGTFAYNQTNSSVISGNVSSFFLDLTQQGNYTWNVYCEDKQLNGAFNGNQTFGIDSEPPLVSISAPTGTYNSLTGIPLTYSVTDLSPTDCVYNVSFSATKTPVIESTLLPNCSSTTFDVDTESNYVLDFWVNDSTGAINFSSANFTVTLTPPDNPGGSGGGGGGGGSGGGGGGGSGLSGLLGLAQLTLTELQPIQLGVGESDIATLDILNSGARFLNICELSAEGDIAEWVSSRQVASLSSGERTEFAFNVNVPLTAEPGTYTSTLIVACNETSASTPLTIDVVVGDYTIVILNSERIGNNLRVEYALEDFVNKDHQITLDYSLVDLNDVIVAQGQIGPLFLAAGTREELTLEFELPKNAGGDFELVFDLTNGREEKTATQRLVLSAPGVAGFAISDDNLRTITWVGGIAFALLIFYAVAKFLSSHSRRVRVHETKGRHFIRINLNERKKRRK